MIYLLLSRAATHARGDFHCDFRAYTKTECMAKMWEFVEADKTFNIKKEYVVAHIEYHVEFEWSKS